MVDYTPLTVEQLVEILNEDERNSLYKYQKFYKSFVNLANSLGENFEEDTELCEVIKYLTTVEVEKRRKFFGDDMPNFIPIIDFSNRLWYHHSTDKYYISTGLTLMFL